MASNQVMALALLVVAAVALLIAVRGERRHVQVRKSGILIAKSESKQSLQRPYFGNTPKEANTPEEAANLAQEYSSENCQRLAIVMSGSNKRHLDMQAEIYHELAPYYYPPSRCIVVVTYNHGKATDDDDYEIWDHLGRAPLYQIHGQFIGAFVESLSVQFRSAILIYMGHGRPNALCTHEGGSTSAEIMKLAKGLKKIAKHVLMIFNACYSSTIALESGAQLLSNKETLYLSWQQMPHDSWNTTEANKPRLDKEMLRLIEHYPGTESHMGIAEAMRHMVWMLHCLGGAVRYNSSDSESLKNQLIQEVTHPNLPPKVWVKLNLFKFPGVTQVSEPSLSTGGDYIDLSDWCPGGYHSRFIGPHTKELLFPNFLNRTDSPTPVFESLLRGNRSHFNLWLKELENEIIQIFTPQNFSGKARMWLFALFRLSAPWLAPPSPPVDLLKRSFDEDSDGTGMAIASAPPTTGCYGLHHLEIFKEFLTKNKGKMQNKKVQFMYNAMRSKTLAEWQPSDNFHVRLRQTEGEDFIITDPLTGDLHVPVQQRETEEGERMINCPLTGDLHVPDPNRWKLGQWTRRFPLSITVGFGKVDALEQGLDEFFEATCTVPTTEGYDFSEAAGVTTIIDFAPTGVKCADGSNRTVSYIACARNGLEYSVSGCEMQPSGCVQCVTMR